MRHDRFEQLCKIIHFTGRKMEDPEESLANFVYKLCDEKIQTKLYSRRTFGN